MWVRGGMEMGWDRMGLWDGMGWDRNTGVNKEMVYPWRLKLEIYTRPTSTQFTNN